MSYFFVLDSETTEDEAAEPQIPLEAKEGARGFQDEAQRVPAGKLHFQNELLCQVNLSNTDLS